MTNALPLVSVLIPAYRARFFGEALASALAQTWPALEVVVCDDSADGAIEQAGGAARDERVRYVRNPERLGFARNFTRCLELARGEYVKFLNDDDRLRPRCVETLVNVMRSDPRVRLATSRRRVIDEHGRPAADVLATMPVSHVCARVFGRELGDFMLANATNFVGEPTTVLLRKSDVVLEDGLLFRWGARDYHCLADMALWLRLLSIGLAYYDADVLSEYRLHAGQEQHEGGMDLGCAQERLWIAREARGLGFLSTPALWRAAMEAVIGHAQFVMGRGIDAQTRAQVAALAEEARGELIQGGRRVPG